MTDETRTPLPELGTNNAGSGVAAADTVEHAQREGDESSVRGDAPREPAPTGETPRTDAVDAKDFMCCPDDYARLQEMRKLSRQLERELAEAETERKRLRGVASQYYDQMCAAQSAFRSASGSTIRLEDHYLTVRRELAAQEERLQVKRVFARGADGIDESLPIVQIVTNNGVDVYVGTPVRSTTQPISKEK